MTSSAPRYLGLALGLGALVAGAFWLLRPESEGEGPEPIVWNEEACAECHMHIGEPGFAAQLHTLDGEILNFDDPGCLLRYEAEHEPKAITVYFHHSREDRWLTQTQSGFLVGSPSPMGYDLRVVERSTPGAMNSAEATRRVLASGPRARP